MQLYVLPGNPPPNFVHRPIYNRAYEHYRRTWTRIFNRPGRPPQYYPSGFYRQNYIFHVEHKASVVAQTLATHYHLNNKITTDLPFFSAMIGKPLEFLKNASADSCLSLEFSSIGREFSPRHLEGLNMYRVIFQLALKYARSLCVDAVIGHPRRLTQTNEVTTEIGCRVLRSGLSKYGVSVDVSIGLLDEVTADNELAVMKQVSKLWDNRIDCIGLSSEQNLEFYNQYLKSPTFKQRKAS